MPKDQLCRQFDRHSIFLFPSHFEGFGLSFLQAIARGLCILGTRVGGMRDGIEPNFNGFLFERGDIPGISQRALWLLENPVALEQLGCNARKSAESYTWDQTAQRFESFCKTLISQPKQT
jgi:glycosyltransferase involved in cell wall biosynthesis